MSLLSKKKSLIYNVNTREAYLFVVYILLSSLASLSSFIIISVAKSL